MILFQESVKLKADVMMSTILNLSLIKTPTMVVLNHAKMSLGVNGSASKRAKAIVSSLPAATTEMATVLSYQVKRHARN